MKTIQDYIKRADELIDLATKTIQTSDGSGTPNWVNSELFATFKTSSLSFIKNLYGPAHPYYTNFTMEVTKSWEDHTYTGRGIISAIKKEIEDGWYFSVKRLITAEIFSDFLEMAKYLLDEKYKDPAAVMLGSILEEHLRQLATKHSIPLTVPSKKGTAPKKADVINADLMKADVYTQIDHKQVTTWLDLRNKAAHGEYTKYTIDQVNLFHDGLLNFLSRVTI